MRVLYRPGKPQPFWDAQFLIGVQEDYPPGGGSKGKALGTLLLARFSKGNCQSNSLGAPGRPQGGAFSAVRPALPPGLTFNIPKWERFKARQNQSQNPGGGIPQAPAFFLQVYLFKEGTVARKFL
ncbi:MAG: hypothetical protein HQL95_07365 [Magnetococcales bacterium]|nr:hypothetical protein [Magnetococcales bacterium]